MNTVDVCSEGIEPPLWLEKLEKFVQQVLNRLDADNWEISVMICSDDRIRELNRQYRGKDEPTDVLTFRQDEALPFPASPDGIVISGDVVISPDTVSRNAAEFDVTFTEELRRVIVHGLLHLRGMDHDTIESGEPMLVLQEEIVSETFEEISF